MEEDKEGIMGVCDQIGWSSIGVNILQECSNFKEVGEKQWERE